MTESVPRSQQLPQLEHANRDTPEMKADLRRMRDQTEGEVDAMDKRRRKRLRAEGLWWYGKGCKER